MACGIITLGQDLLKHSTLLQVFGTQNEVKRILEYKYITPHNIYSTLHSRASDQV